MDEDAPTDQAKETPATVIHTASADWSKYPDGSAILMLIREPVDVVDFYREPA